MLSVQHNLLAMNANRQLGVNTQKNSKSAEKLSSGYRVNRSADDAAGLSISEKMRRQIRGLTQASSNAQDGISMVQSAEGALNEMHDILHRANELAVKAATETLSDEDRSLVDAEIQQLKEEIDTMAQHTVFNELRLFPDDGLSPKSASRTETYHYALSYDLRDGSFQIGSASTDATARAGSDVASTESVLADKIANELLPNAIKQIFDAFPSLKNATGSDTIDMALDVSFLDGPGNTLAYASYSYYPSGGKPVSMSIKVDTADFDEDDALGTGPNAEMLESTLAHELMHSVMQYNLTDGMSGRTNDPFPSWFIEGTAQLAGGGFPTGWNSYLSSVANTLSDATDASKDANVKAYLQAYTPGGRPYGHGYLASAYLGYLANKQATGDVNVTGANIAAGMDRIFSDLLGGKSFADSIKDNTGLASVQSLEQLFANGDSDLVGFVRQLSYESRSGAGSVITPSLADGGTDILGNSAPAQQFRIDPSQVHVDLESGAAATALQVGANAGQHIDINFYQMNTDALGLKDTNVKTTGAAGDAINEVKQALSYVSKVRSYYGAIQNRLEHTISNLDNIVENTTAAESSIRDTDMATEMVDYSNYQILLQAGQSMLSQANRQSDIVLGLLS